MSIQRQIDAVHLTDLIGVIIALSLIAKIALGVGTSKLSIGFSTQEPYCETVPTFPDAYSSECNETVAYQTGEDCKTQCNAEIVSTCSCLYSVGGLSKYLFIKNFALSMNGVLFKHRS